jgi:hypothetical protein
MEEVRKQLAQAAPGSASTMSEATLASLNNRIDDVAQQIGRMQAASKGVLLTASTKESTLQDATKVHACVLWRSRSWDVQHPEPLHSQLMNDQIECIINFQGTGLSIACIDVRCVSTQRQHKQWR